jgi:protein-disulfide isomerase
MRFYSLAALALVAALVTFGQQPAQSVINWETSTELPGVDTKGLTPQQVKTALGVLREEGCTCGCQMKVAECRIKDPACSYSRTISALAVKEVRAGKDAKQARAAIAAANIAPKPPRVLEDPVTINVNGAPVKGSPDAKITIVEFSDFQCPYCSVAVGHVNAVLEMYPKDVKLIFKQFPLDTHPQAHLAAQASLAANGQGKFWPMHDKLFANPRKITRDNILLWAKEIGLDMNRFTADLTSGKYKAAVDKDFAEGEQLGVGGTPTFFLNGKKYNGSLEPSHVKPVLDAELKSMQAKK